MPGQLFQPGGEWSVRNLISYPFGCIGICTSDGIFIEINDAFFFGITRSDVIGKNFWEEDLWKQSSKSQVDLQSAFGKAAAGETVQFEIAMERQDGRIGFADVSLGPVGKGADATTQIAIYAVDTTLQKEAFHKLSEQKLYLDSIIESAPAIVLLLNEGGLIEHTNKHFPELTGYSREETLGKDWFSMFLPERDRDRTRDLFHRSRTTKTPFKQNTHTNPIVTRDGEERQIEWHNHAWHSVNGSIAGLMSIGHDITEREKTKFALEENAALLAEAQHLLSIGVWQFDLMANTLRWSDEIYQMFEINSDFFTASYETFLNVIHPDDRERVDLTYQTSLKTRLPYTIQYQLLMSDGRVKHVVVNCENKYDTSGRPIQSIGTVLDITERVQMENELRHSMLLAEEANRAKSDFLSNMSHELRTPLNAIMGFAQILSSERDAALTPKQLSRIHEIQFASEHLLELINDILDLSTIETGRANLSIGSVNLGNVVRDAEALAQKNTEHSSITITYSHDSMSGVWVAADPVRLKQVILNLLTNAVKYNHPKGFVDIVCSTNEDSTIRVEIRDTGIGIPADQRQMIFKPFSRLKQTKTETEGTGIGLVICKQLIESMDGHIGFSSAQGEGSTFWIDLPACPNRPQQEEVPNPVEVVLEQDAGHATILCIEDNSANLRLIESIFEDNANFTIISAQTGMLGIEVARCANPDLILLDMGLPDIDGFTVFKMLKAESETSNIPIVVISADALSFHRERALDAGISDYLTKPIRVPELMGTIAKLLRSQGSNSVQAAHSPENVS